MGCQIENKHVFLTGVIENVVMTSSRHNNYFNKTAYFITYLRLISDGYQQIETVFITIKNDNCTRTILLPFVGKKHTPYLR